jgi:hypothetical protein
MTDLPHPPKEGVMQRDLRETTPGNSSGAMSGATSGPGHRRHAAALRADGDVIS